MKYSIIFYVGLLLPFQVFAFGPKLKSPLQEGDLIFHQSQSLQSAAIQEATGSKWTHMGVILREDGEWMVEEAVGPVKKTPLKTFIERGKDHHYSIKRLKPEILKLGAAEIARLKRALASYEGRGYDFYFEWNDQLIYCSELAYKAFQFALGVAPGTIQKFRDMHTDGPLIQDLIQKRYVKAGKVFNPDELVITPVSMHDSPLLNTVIDN
jgi:hypothetical protein